MNSVNMEENEVRQSPDITDAQFVHECDFVPAVTETIIDKLEAVAELLQAHDGDVPKETAAGVGVLIYQEAEELRNLTLATLTSMLNRLGKACGAVPEEPEEEPAEEAAEPAEAGPDEPRVIPFPAGAESEASE